MNFYELKNNLNFPHLGGAITRKADVAALYLLNLDECSAIQNDIDALMLNQYEALRHGFAASIARLERLKALHEADVDTIAAYMKQHKMEL